ncbi:hypothetical protein MPTK1_1g24600 [Marchantia polymorpha subsp. ruderalis]|uniref:Uncharacterized protein n=2 Tax=Marchantia polymorpha TaxID=3197 RepID=A0AAF6ATW0_MARPO|nr:hypothetical protein MARPO_0061s0062 [Marchantia polymorpha]BBM99880.1 hypothetical protein Mp_1g24600 [Marchantia polymorpha subsp. ruderalis]|eukprot:PTQ36805.1 hypothetical protein MARPO_0061s0062 [Marchantia polymorpha]
MYVQEKDGKRLDSLMDKANLWVPQREGIFAPDVCQRAHGPNPDCGTLRFSGNHISSQTRLQGSQFPPFGTSFTPHSIFGSRCTWHEKTQYRIEWNSLNPRAEGNIHSDS